MKLEELHEELQFLSDRLSTQVRTVALSVIALVWLFVAGGTDAPTLLSAPSRHALLWIALLALSALVLDYLQYVAGYVASDAVRKRAEKAGEETTEYDYTDWRYRSRTVLFWLKQVAVAVSVVWLGVEMIRALV